MTSVRQFPVIAPRDNRGRVLGGCPTSVPWSLVEAHQAQAMSNHSQTLERLAERGGLSPGELHAVVHDRKWRPMDIDAAVAWLVERMSERICIIGGPRTGKTTLAQTMSNVLHTDDLIGQFDWSGVSEFVASDWLARPGPWVIEGVAVVRALRKWLSANAEGVPCELVILLLEPLVELSKGQAAMAKGHERVWHEVRPLLLARGVVVQERAAR